MGDVLRSTSILHGIYAKYPSANVTWYTKKNCADIFLNNPAVDQLLFLEDPASSWLLQAQTWDIVYALDSSLLTASICSTLKARERLGYMLDDNGVAMPANSDASIWMEMGLNDQSKKENKQSFFEHLFYYSRLNWADEYRPQIVLTNTEIEEARQYHEHFLSGRKLLIGINPGAGERWRYKRWTESGFASLIDRLNALNDVRIVLLGGADDQPVITDILSRCTSPQHTIVAPAGTVRTFIKYIEALDLIVCGDTMALHLATARRKAVIALFGPTSAVEIDLFRIGEKIVAPIECQGCYLPDCDKAPTCMDVITIDRVFDAVIRQLADLRAQPALVGTQA
jgi:ADP-heptose:LPS heptosyltransferase